MRTQQALIQVMTSQGIVSSVEPGYILQIDVEKFSEIEHIFNNESTTGISDIF